MINRHSATTTAGAAVLAGLTAATVLGMPAASAAPTQKLNSFGTGEVTIDGDSATIVNDAGEYGGVYLSSRSMSAKPLQAVHFSFVSDGEVAGGAPRFSIPIDVDRNAGTDDGYAFLDVANCGDGTDEAVEVSTDNQECAVFYGQDSYANWAAFAKANPTYRIAPGVIPFVIADVPGQYSISHVDLR